MPNLPSVPQVLKTSPLQQLSPCFFSRFAFEPARFICDFTGFPICLTSLPDLPLQAMAEVIGLVSSGIAIAQLAGSVGAVAIKLNGLWQEVKDVPETIQYMTNHLSKLDTIVNEMGTSRNSNSPHDSAAGQPHHPSPSPLALQHCQMACQNLESLVRDLSVDIASSRKRKRLMGKVAVVLKKDTLAKYELRLQNAVQLLSLAYQVYTT